MTRTAESELRVRRIAGMSAQRIAVDQDWAYIATGSDLVLMHLPTGVTKASDYRFRNLNVGTNNVDEVAIVDTDDDLRADLAFVADTQGNVRSLMVANHRGRGDRFSSGNGLLKAQDPVELEALSMGISGETIAISAAASGCDGESCTALVAVSVEGGQSVLAEISGAQWQDANRLPEQSAADMSRTTQSDPTFGQFRDGQQRSFQVEGGVAELSIENLDGEFVAAAVVRGGQLGIATFDADDPSTEEDFVAVGEGADSDAIHIAPIADSRFAVAHPGGLTLVDPSRAGGAPIEIDAQTMGVVPRHVVTDDFRAIVVGDDEDGRTRVVEFDVADAILGSDISIIRSVDLGENVDVLDLAVNENYVVIAGGDAGVLIVEREGAQGTSTTCTGSGFYDVTLIGRWNDPAIDQIALTANPRRIVLPNREDLDRSDVGALSPVHRRHHSGWAGLAHPDDFTLFSAGESAPQGLELLAELGNPGPMRLALEDRAGEVVRGDGFNTPGQMTTELTVDPENPRVSIATMLAPSPDWFVGVSSVSLCRGGQWIEQLAVDSPVYDVGSDDNNKFVVFEPEYELFDVDGDGVTDEVVGAEVDEDGSITVNGAIGPLGAFHNDDPVVSVQEDAVDAPEVTTLLNGPVATFVFYRTN